MRSTSLIAAAAFLIHQLRYLAATGGLDGGDFLQRGNTIFLHSIPLLVGVVIACLTARLVNGPNDERRSIAVSPSTRVVTYVAAVIAVVSAQQLIEGVLLAGHVAGLAAIFAAGGWAALPLAAFFGLLAAIVDRGIEAADSLVSTLITGRAAGATASIEPAAPPAIRRAWAPLISGFARRPPPALS